MNHCNVEQIILPLKTWLTANHFGMFFYCIATDAWLQLHFVYIRHTKQSILEYFLNLHSVLHTVMFVSLRTKVKKYTDCSPIFHSPLLERSKVTQMILEFETSIYSRRNQIAHEPATTKNKESRSSHSGVRNIIKPNSLSSLNLIESVQRPRRII